MLRVILFSFAILGLSACQSPTRVAMPMAAVATPVLSLDTARTQGETLAALRSALAKRPLTVFAEIDHAAGAEGAGLDLAPAVVVIFGNPKGGTPLMQAAPDMGLDMPLRMLVRATPNGARLVWSDIEALASARGVPAGNPGPAAMADLLRALAQEAAGLTAN